LRDGPIVCRDGVTVFVPGLGLDARARADGSEAQVALTWLPVQPDAGDRAVRDAR